MRTTGMLMLAATLCAAQAHAENLQASLMQMEQEAWTGWANHDPAPNRKYSTEDFSQLMVGQQLIGLDSVIGWVVEHPCKLNSFKLEDAAIQQLTPDALILRYRVRQDGECDGQRMDPVVWATATYVRRDGAWNSAFYQETPAG